MKRNFTATMISVVRSRSKISTVACAFIWWKASSRQENAYTKKNTRTCSHREQTTYKRTHQQNTCTSKHYFIVIQTTFYRPLQRSVLIDGLLNRFSHRKKTYVADNEANMNVLIAFHAIHQRKHPSRLTEKLLSHCTRNLNVRHAEIEHQELCWKFETNKFAGAEICATIWVFSSTMLCVRNTQMPAFTDDNS